MNIVKKQIKLLIDSKLYLESTKIYCFICLYTSEILNLLKKYDKIKIIKTKENLYEKFAINNFKKYLENKEYLVYYFHSKGVTRTGKNYDDWTYICNYFTIKKWKINVLLLEYFDCIGINLKYYPNIHFSGNFWWSKSKYINKLNNNINKNYLSPEMYICSDKDVKIVSIFNSNIRHDVTEYDKIIILI